jgi:uncharacterized protein (TIGR00369 family)
MSEATLSIALAQQFAAHVPHMRDLGIRLLSVASDHAQAALPLRSEFLGDRDRGLIHPGVVTSLIDSVCGFAVHARIGGLVTIATLDLRVDYLRPLRPPRELICRAECYRLTAHIAFARAWVWQEHPDQPAATSLATFMHTPRSMQQDAP